MFSIIHFNCIAKLSMVVMICPKQFSKISALFFVLNIERGKAKYTVVLNNQ